MVEDTQAAVVAIEHNLSSACGVVVGRSVSMAIGRGDQAVAVWHLLLSLAMDDCPVSAIMKRCGLSATKIEVCLSAGTPLDIPVGKVGLDESAQVALRMAADLAFAMDHHYVGTQHLLIALTDSRSVIAMPQVFDRWAVNCWYLQQLALEHLNDYPEWSRPTRKEVAEWARDYRSQATELTPQERSDLELLESLGLGDDARQVAELRYLVADALEQYAPEGYRAIAVRNAAVQALMSLLCHQPESTQALADYAWQVVETAVRRALRL